MNWSLLQNSLLVSGATTLLAMVLGFWAALWLAGARSLWRNAGLVVAVAALAMPPFLVTNCWLDLLGVNGVLRGWLPLNIFSLPGSAFVLALLLWPITTLAVWSRWERLEPELLEVEPALRGWRLIRHLLVPVARTPLVFSGALTFVLALNNFAVPSILQVKVFPAEMWISFSTNFDALAALKLSLPLIVAPLVLLVLFARSDFSWPTLRGMLPARIFRQQLGRAGYVTSAIVMVMLGALSVVVPLLELATTARTWLELPGAVEAGQGALWNSIWLAAGTATLCVAIALFFGARTSVRFPALGLRTRRRNEFRVPWPCVAWLPFLIPGVLIGIAFIWIFNRPATAWFYSSFGVVLLAFALRYFALGGSITRHALQTTDSELNDAARLEGASRWQSLRLVQWPQIAPQVAAAWYVIYLLCLWDVESLVLIVPPGGETLALRIFNLLHYGHNAQVNALCLTLLGAAVVPLGIWTVWRWMKACCVLRVPLAAGAAALCMLLAGCSPSSSSRSAPLQSKFFERAEVIATRGVGVGEVNKPRSVAVDHEDNVYVVDMTGRVQKFSPQGKFFLAWQMPQTTRGKPKGMGCDNDGNIIVVEPHYKRLNHFNTNGQLVAQWGITGTNAGQLDMPRSVAENSKGEIFVSEYGLVERVQKFSLSKSLKDAPPLHWNPNETDEQALSETRPTPATFLACYSKLGSGPGEFNRAEGICVDGQDRLYVADSCNHRVQVFSSDGKFIREFGKPGSGPGELSYPYDIKVNAAGNIFVCEFGNSRIQVFDDAGHSLEIIGEPGVKPGQFNNPWSIELDSHGNLYVADALNHRVQKLVRRKETSNSDESRAGIQHPTTNIQRVRTTALLDVGCSGSASFRVPLPVAQVSQPAVSPISQSAGCGISASARASHCHAGLETRDTADLEVCATFRIPHSALRVSS